MAMHLIGVYPIGMHLLMGMHPKGVAKSVSDPWGATIIKGDAMYNGSRILPAEAHLTDLRVGLPELWRRGHRGWTRRR
jgi:hypothetical protein